MTLNIVTLLSCYFPGTVCGCLISFKNANSVKNNRPVLGKRAVIFN